MSAGESQPRRALLPRCLNAITGSLCGLCLGCESARMRLLDLQQSEIEEVALLLGLKERAVFMACCCKKLRRWDRSSQRLWRHIEAWPEPQHVQGFGAWLRGRAQQLGSLILRSTHKADQQFEQHVRLLVECVAKGSVHTLEVEWQRGRITLGKWLEASLPGLQALVVAAGQVEVAPGALAHLTRLTRLGLVGYCGPPCATDGAGASQQAAAIAAALLPQSQLVPLLPKSLVSLTLDHLQDCPIRAEGALPPLAELRLSWQGQGHGREALRLWAPQLAPTLTYLSLGPAGLAGTLPIQLADLTGLVVLDLESAGRLYDAKRALEPLAALRKLTRLGLLRCGLMDVSAEVLALPRLKELSLEFNDFYTFRPLPLNAAAGLERLSLSLEDAARAAARLPALASLHTLLLHVRKLTDGMLVKVPLEGPELEALFGALAGMPGLRQLEVWEYEHSVFARDVLGQSPGALAAYTNLLQLRPGLKVAVHACG